MGKKLIYKLVFGVSLLFSSCATNVPDKFVENGKDANIYPDYTQLTIPINIAPLNFHLEEEAEDAVVRISGGECELTIAAGKKGEITIPPAKWKELLAKNSGNSISYDVYAKRDGQWEHYKTFTNSVSADSIDPYLTYRLIEPSYMGMGEIGVYQFDLENAVEKAVFTNHRDYIKCNNRKPKCLNCHTAQRKHPENKMFYYRSPQGGLILTYKGKTQKINTRCGDMFASTVYPAWHPTLPFIAFSSNKIMQSFNSIGKSKIDFYDEYSDLVLYDIEKNEISPIRKTYEKQESNPCWSADGEYLYFNSTDTLFSKYNDPRKMLYNIYRVKFDATNKTWGENELIYEAAKKGKSATYPKASPDGKFLLITESTFGPNGQTNDKADLYMIDLGNMQVREMEEANCPTESDSYHDWSCNSKWIVFCSRREDGNYARPFFCHIGKDGKASKPFILPRANSRYHANLIKNYNVTEFSTTPVETSIQDFQKTLESEEIKASYNGPVDMKAVDAYSAASPVRQ